MTLIKFYGLLGWTEQQIKAFVILPKITGAFSFLGSSYIVFSIIRDPKKQEMTYHRIMFGMSILDMLSSFSGPLLSTWPMPRGYHMYAFGTSATCEAAAFFHQLGVCGTPLYNCCLVTFYCLLLKHNWTKSRIANVEKYFHIIPWTVCLSVSIAAIPCKVYGPSAFSCW